MRLSLLDRALAWLVTGAPGRGYAFTLNFASGLRTIWKARRS
jgi:hypothetical protein